MELKPQSNPKSSDHTDPTPRIRKRNSAHHTQVKNSFSFDDKPGLSQKISGDSMRQRYSSIIIEPDGQIAKTLRDWFSNLFPEIRVLAIAKDFGEARNELLLHRYDLIFTNVDLINDIRAILPAQGRAGIISMSDTPQDAIQALRNNMCGFITKPLDRDDVIISVRCAIDKINKARAMQKASREFHLPHTKMVGVPTPDGIEFIDTDTIIRCEGLQKCTLIITTEKSDIISSYSIGKFINLLGDHGFFSCHRSHYINLKFVKKYSREGYIFFSANSKPVPLARRRKCDFLNQIKHL